MEGGGLKSAATNLLLKHQTSLYICIINRADINMCQGAETLNKPAVLINKHRLITNEIPLDCPDNWSITDNGMLTHSSLFLFAWNGNLTPQRKVLHYLLHVHTLKYCMHSHLTSLDIPSITLISLNLFFEHF